MSKSERILKLQGLAFKVGKTEEMKEYKKRRGSLMLVEDKIGGIDNPVMEDDPFNYIVYYEDHPLVEKGEVKRDDDLVVLVKEMVNTSRITRSYLIKNFVGKGNLLSDKGVAYNLEYGLRNRKSITWDTAQIWARICGKKITLGLEELNPLN